MSGRARFRALVTELERRTRESYEDVEGQPPARTLDYVCDWMASGQTMKSLALDLSVATHTEVTHARLMAYLKEVYGETERDTQLDSARARASHAMAEDAIDLVDAAGDTSAEIAKASAQAKSRQWMAERYNPARFGVQRGHTVHISVGSLHLDALRAPGAATLPSSDSIERAPRMLKYHASDTPQVVDAQEVTIT